MLKDEMRQFAINNGLAELQDATMAARSRTQINYGTQVKGGLFRVIRMDYGIKKEKKGSRVTVLTQWICKGRVIEFLNKL